MNHTPLRGEVWQIDLSPELDGADEYRRLCVIISDDTFNQGCADVSIVLPLGPSDQGVALRVMVKPPEAGLEDVMYIIPEMLRSVSKKRLVKRVGEVTPLTMHKVDLSVQSLLAL